MIKNVVILMGRGIEGCGVTKYTIELAKYLGKKGYIYKILASGDKNWSRKKSHPVDNIELVKFADDSKLEGIVATCNSADVVLINSLPVKNIGNSRGYPEEAIENFKKIIGSITKPIIPIQHDHNNLSIIRNGALEEVLDKCRAVFSHAEDNDFVKFVKNYTNDGNPLMSFFGESRSIPIHTFQPGMYFDEVRKKYWKPVNQIDKRINRWIGRCVTWKGYDPIIKFHKQYLRQAGYCTVLEGIEKSPAFLDFKDKYEFINNTAVDIKDVDLKQHYGEDVMVFNIFNNEELLERMSTTGFGYQLTHLDPSYVKHSIEYTHCEVPSTGTISVFNEKFGKLCIHRKTGNPIIEDDSGTLWLSYDNMPETLEKINKLSNDDVLYDETREKIYEYYKSHQDADAVFDELMNKIGEYA